MFSSTDGPPEELAGSARGVDGQKRVSYVNVADVGAGSNARDLFFLHLGFEGILVGAISHKTISRAANPRNARRTDWEKNGVSVRPVCRLGAAIGVAVGDGVVV